MNEAERGQKRARIAVIIMIAALVPPMAGIAYYLMVTLARQGVEQDRPGDSG